MPDPPSLDGVCRSVCIILSETVSALNRVGDRIWIFYFEEIGVFKAGLRQNILAWNNNLGLLFYFVGF